MKNHALLLAALLTTTAPAATQVDIPGPPGSGEFGTTVTVLPNGNFVVTDPLCDNIAPPVADVGAVYLYTPEGALISTLRGSFANDQVGNTGIVLLSNGNFLVRSPSWNNGVGALTWGSATTGFIGGANVTVSAANSLVGSTPGDNVSFNGVTTLTNGNYVVRSSNWDNPSPAAANAGAVTWGNGATGTSGPVTSANSLVGSNFNDFVGSNGVTALTNGNYVVSSPGWDNTSPAAIDAGAVTWGNGTSGTSGPVSAANSIVGTTASDQVGSNVATALTNGNYVTRTTLWDNTAPAALDAGATTWGNGATGTSGPVSSANSLVGTSHGDRVGSSGITPLTNGNYVVRSGTWDNTSPAATDAGAATWANGTTGITGPVTPANSLVGTTASDAVGNIGVTALTNGHYVVRTPNWDNTAPATTNAGAATWGNGTTGTFGPVTPANSLVGTTASDSVGIGGVTALTNGNYVVVSPSWDNTTAPATNAGAATWGSGTTGIKGPVSPANSLVGSSPNDSVGNTGITALTNGHYVVLSPNWDNTAPTAAEAGAATWGNGFTGIKGPITAANSLVGTTANDFVGSNGVAALTNDNYVVSSSVWDNGGTADVGAVTWGNGATGIKGPVSLANSLVGTNSTDQVGIDRATALPNGNYIVRNGNWINVSTAFAGAITWANGSTGIIGSVSAANSLVGSTASDQIGIANPTVLSDGNCLFTSAAWNNGGIGDAGAVTLFDGQNGTAGPITTANSVLGTVASGGNLFVSGYDPARKLLIVGRRSSNLVTLFRGDRLRSLAKTNFDAPGAPDIAYAKPGTTAVNPSGSTLTDYALTGSGSKGKNRALFAHSPATGADLVLQTGTPLSTLGGGLPSNAVATALLGQIFNQPNRALFQATAKGTGISTANNRLLLLDNGVGVQLLHRTGTPVAPLGSATLASYTEVLQSHNQNFITLAYKLKTGGSVTTANDEGLLFLDHTGNVNANTAAREGQPAFDGGGDFGSFNGRAAAGLGNVIHFTALFKPTGLKPIPAVFSTSLDGVTTARLAKAGDLALNSGSADYKTFAAISQQSGDVLIKATLNNSLATQNEGLYRLPAPGLLTRKGDPIGGGLNIARIVRFWPAGIDQVILHVQVTGTGVSGANNQVLVLRQSDNAYLTLLRTGFPAPGTGPATVKAFSAIDVNPVTGRYAILGTLSGSPSTSNQALWTGNPILGADTPLAQQSLRLPQLTLRKGNPYSTTATPSGLIRSIAFKPALDPTGAGGRGLAQALGATGDLALFITGDRNLTELVLLDR